MLTYVYWTIDLPCDVIYLYVEVEQIIGIYEQ